VRASDVSSNVPRRLPGAGMLILRALWGCVRFPILAVLVVLEPLVRFAFAALALLLVVTALFLEMVSARGIPFVPMLAAGGGCVGVLVLYQALIRTLS
jgi:hypothetical protein